MKMITGFILGVLLTNSFAYIFYHEDKDHVLDSISKLSSLGVYVGMVSKVSDGDTFHVKTASGYKKVRLYGVDAPEMKQKGGKEIYKRVESLLLDKKVIVSEQTTDKYGRAVAQILLFTKSDKKQDVGAMLLEKGMVWYTPRYCKKQDPCDGYAMLFDKVKNQKIGIFKDKDIQSPEEWRRKHKRNF